MMESMNETDLAPFLLSHIVTLGKLGITVEYNRNSDAIAGHIVRATSSGKMNAPKMVCKKVHFSFFMLI